VHTEVIQAILLIVGSVILTFFCLSEVGGWSGFMAGLDSLNASGYIDKPSAEVFDMAGPINDDYMPWTGLLFGVPLLGFYFWANNQFMVQRVLSAKDLNHGRWGALFAGLMKVPVIFFMIFPGVMAVVLFSDLDISGLQYYITNDAGNKVICANLSDCPNMTYPVLIYQLLPTGILGLVIAGLLAAMSSSISATLNSASTLITMDFVTKFNPSLSSKGLVRVGQIATVVLVLLAAFWTQYIEQISDSLWEYLQLVLGFIAPPVVAVFLVGLFWKRGNGNGAIAALVGGVFISAFIIASSALDISPYINDIHFLHKAPLLMLCCIIIHIIVSLATAPPDIEKVEHLTWNIGIFKEETIELKDLPWYKNYRILSIFLLVITAIVVGWFW